MAAPKFGTKVRYNDGTGPNDELGTCVGFILGPAPNDPSKELVIVLATPNNYTQNAPLRALKDYGPEGGGVTYVLAQS